MIEWYWFWKDKDNDSAVAVAIYWIFKRSCKSITEDLSIVEPDINNSTAIGEGESNAVCFTKDINLIPYKGIKEVRCYFWLE